MAVGELTGLGLKETQDQVKAFPKVIKEELDREEAENLKANLEAAGSEVSLKARTA